MKEDKIKIIRDREIIITNLSNQPCKCETVWVLAKGRKYRIQYKKDDPRCISPIILCDNNETVPISSPTGQNVIKEAITSTIIGRSSSFDPSSTVTKRTCGICGHRLSRYNTTRACFSHFAKPHDNDYSPEDCRRSSNPGIHISRMQYQGK